MPGSDELWRRKIMATEENHEEPVRRTRNDMKRIREDMEEDLENIGYNIFFRRLRRLSPKKIIPFSG